MFLRGTFIAIEFQPFSVKDVRSDNTLFVNMSEIRLICWLIGKSVVRLFGQSVGHLPAQSVPPVSTFFMAYKESIYGYSGRDIARLN